MGVPSIRSAPRTMRTGPTSGRCSMASSRTLDRPRGLGRKGERVAKTPIRVLPPRRGGRTVGDQPSRTAPENCHTSQMWLKSSSPRTASAQRYSGVKMTSPRRLSTSPLWRGMPNLVGKAVRIWAMTLRAISSGADISSSPYYKPRQKPTARPSIWISSSWGPAKIMGGQTAALSASSITVSPCR